MDYVDFICENGDKMIVKTDISVHFKSPTSILSIFHRTFVVLECFSSEGSCLLS